MPAPLDKKKRYLAFSLLVLPLAAIGVLVFFLTRRIDPGWRQTPNPVEANEARKKLKLYHDAEQRKTAGFVRLNEVEINSYLQIALKPANSVSGETSLQLKDVGVKLTSTNLTYFCWTERQAFGVAIPLVLQRTASIVRGEDKKWKVEIESMKVGKTPIPRPLWGWVGQRFAGLDQGYVNQTDWLFQIPTVVIMENELNQMPEVRLYTYVPHTIAQQ